MRTDAPRFQAGLSDRGFETLKRRLVDLVEPLSDHQLLDLADGIHDVVRPRRTGRRQPAVGMNDRLRDGLPI